MEELERWRIWSEKQRGKIHKAGGTDEAWDAFYDAQAKYEREQDRKEAALDAISSILSCNPKGNPNKRQRSSSTRSQILGAEKRERVDGKDGITDEDDGVSDFNDESYAPTKRERRNIGRAENKKRNVVKNQIPRPTTAPHTTTRDLPKFTEKVILSRIVKLRIAPKKLQKATRPTLGSIAERESQKIKAELARTKGIVKTHSNEERTVRGAIPRRDLSFPQGQKGFKFPPVNTARLGYDSLGPQAKSSLSRSDRNGSE
jgi:hypothetical protein